MASELTKLIVIFVIGGLVGAGLAGYALQQNPRGTAVSSSSSSSVKTTTITQIYVSQVSTVTATTGASNYIQLANALNNSYNAKLNVTSYMFLNSEHQQDLLIAQIQNIGNNSIVVAPSDCLLNNTFFAQTKIGPFDPVVVYGQFVYVAPGENFVIYVKLPFTPSIGDKTTLSIYDNSWILPFGTATSGA